MTCPCFRPSGLQRLCRRVDCSCAGRSESRSLFVLVPVVVFVTPLASRPADCRVVAAPRLCVTSRAGIRIVSQELASPVCPSNLSYLRLRRPLWRGRDTKRWFYRSRFVRSRSGRSPFFVIHTQFPPVGIGYGSRASGRLANRTSCEHFLMNRHFVRETYTYTCSPMFSIDIVTSAPDDPYIC